ncbi:inositol monophosphatase family protein [Actinomycetes bacterium KLBMP 9797]
MESDLELARRATLAGAAVALGYFAAFAALRREIKPDGTVVTEADHAVEAAIRRVLTEARPDDAIVGEEGGQTGQGDRRWIIDPIDGTAPFVAGDNRWQVLVALEEAGEIVVGVAAVPAQRRIWWARRGAGAFEAAITDSDVPSPEATGPSVPTAGIADSDGTRSHITGSGIADPGGTGSDGTGSDGTRSHITGSGIADPGGTGSDGTGSDGTRSHITGSGIAGGRRITVGRDRPDTLAGSRFGVVPDDRLTAAERDAIAPLAAAASAVPWATYAALLVANGQLDFAVQVRGQIWDFAAPSLIVTEAGGHYGGLDGHTRPAPGLAVFARSATLHAAALRLLNPDLP